MNARFDCTLISGEWVPWVQGDDAPKTSSLDPRYTDIQFLHCLHGGGDALPIIRIMNEPIQPIAEAETA